MQYLKTSLTGVYVEFDPTTKTAKVIDKAEAEKELAFNQAQLASLPQPLTEKEKAEYYDEHIDEIKTEQSKALIEANITKLNQQIAGMK